jgi:hypothetical protein
VFKDCSRTYLVEWAGVTERTSIEYSAPPSASVEKEAKDQFEYHCLELIPFLVPKVSGSPYSILFEPNVTLRPDLIPGH